ncbi:hypothetical protein DPMN_122193 [Dreissena polymorpha]|uniref:Uncharacterized protein n=1 Tax=Dreissena polymorpha TaxID=45954 RepID=A0A9D4JU90_DREPO|nr:hypothetical protein DPMN_122193 [Dreissena polymorpha]
MLSPNSSSPSSSSCAGSSSPSSSDSSSNGGRSLPGLEVIGSRLLLDLAGLVAEENGSEDGSSCKSHQKGSLIVLEFMIAQIANVNNSEL